MISSNVLKTYSLLLLIFLVVACATKKNISDDLVVEEKPKLLFLNYNIVKIDSTEKIISLINQKTTDGQLKKKRRLSDKTQFGDLECISLDKDFNEISTYSIKNPLIKIVEYINDFGNFEKKVLDLDSAQFSMRLQMQSKVKYIRISELTKKGTIKHITTEIK